VKSVADIDRRVVFDVLDRALRGGGSLTALPFPVRGAGGIRTYLIETNTETNDDAIARADRFGFDVAGSFVMTADASMGLVVHDEGGMVVDMVDPRFWLVHVAAPSAWADAVVSSTVRRSTDLDWGWLPTSHLDAIQALGSTRWFKSDFRGDELLDDQAPARRLKVQLEGEDAGSLRRLIASQPAYQAANSLTGLAVDYVHDNAVVREAAHYRGSFQIVGPSFEAHQAFLSTVADSYASAVRHVERDASIGWTEVGDEGHRVTGGVIEIRLGSPIRDQLAFTDQLLSAKDPFRLWGIPIPTDDVVEAEVVDLHIGRRFRLDVLRDSLRLYLDQGVCGNTVFRLLANLQHRRDATASAWLRGEKIA
jgi:hypothetical protein